MHFIDTTIIRPHINLFEIPIIFSLYTTRIGLEPMSLLEVSCGLEPFIRGIGNNLG